jgi:hypothetical protein
MANTPTYDAVAVEIVTEGMPAGAVVFKGWVGPAEGEQVAAGDPVTSDKIRFFTYRDFREWLEIKRTDILYHVKADADDPEDGSVIWVKREAWIRKCHSGRAYVFDELMAEMEDDPTARHPRP